MRRKFHSRTCVAEVSYISPPHPRGRNPLKVAGFLPPSAPLLTFYRRGRVGEHVSRLASGEYQTPSGERERERKHVGISHHLHRSANAELHLSPLPCLLGRRPVDRLSASASPVCAKPTVLLMSFCPFARTLALLF